MSRPAYENDGQDWTVGVYRPSYVAASVIEPVVRELLPELSISSPNEGRGAIYVRGLAPAVERFKILAQAVDVEQQNVEVQAILAEVSTGDRAGWSVEAIASALSGRLGVTIGGGAGGAGGSSLSFSGPDFSAVLGVVSSLSNTRILNAPSVSGESCVAQSIEVGNEVPILGAVVVPQGGTAVQDVKYRSSGAIFQVTPCVRGRAIALAYRQELSAFAETETGVRGSPTLAKRSITGAVNVRPGEFVIIGGLSSTDAVTARQSLLGLIPIGRSRVERRSELVVILTARALPRAREQSVALSLPVSPDAAERN